MLLQRVTPWNAHKLREAIINGSEIHPGATNFADEVSNCRLPLGKKARISISRKLPSSRGEASAKSLEMEGKIVYCHMKDGDVVLVNRQVLNLFTNIPVMISLSFNAIIYIS